MIPVTSSFGAPPWLQAIQPVQSVVSPFWQAENVHMHLNNLRETIDLLKAVKNELEEILLIKRSHQSTDNGNDLSSLSSNDSSLNDVSHCSQSGMVLPLSELIKAKRISLNVQESLSLEAANSIFSSVKNQLKPFSAITSQTSSWEERSVAVRLAQKLQKSRRNKRWKKRKRQRLGELLDKEHEDYEKADQDADEWRTRELAKDIAKRKVERMKEIARLKAKEETRRLEAELELVLVVEKLKELRSVRIQKLKKQGHFLPEEDDKFLERVRAAVEEEERLAASVTDIDAAKDAIAIAEESRKSSHYTSTESNDANYNKDAVMPTLIKEHFDEKVIEGRSLPTEIVHPDRQKVAQGCGGTYDYLANLPFEFYHYYHGSNNDMGTLIEVRRMWDAYIKPGGSRIPGHWIQPPQPADEVWASYLVDRK